MTKIVNLFGGPGVGKSTTAAGIFHELKRRDLKAEYVSEVAKDYVWEGTTKLLENQIHIFSEQFRRQWRLLNKVDYVITDSPILLSGIYYRHYLNGHCTSLFSEAHTDITVRFFDATFAEFDNMNFVLNRTKKYQPTGRLQSEDDAKKIDSLVMDKLDEMNLSFSLMNYETAVQDIIRVLIQEE